MQCMVLPFAFKRCHAPCYGTVVPLRPKNIR